MYIPEIISVVIKHNSHYEEIAENGFKIIENTENIAERISCSAGQARDCTVLFCVDSIINKVEKRLNNDRDLNKPLVPSKFNAYFGLYSSGTKLVTEPKIAIVPDYINEVTFKCNFVEETEWNLDDKITEKDITVKMNRTDGMGIILPSLAEQWSRDLGLDYNCYLFIIRQSFLKGLVATIDFHDFCEKENNGNYIIKGLYKDKDGKSILIDLRECNMIVSESQFKLWSSYQSQKAYIEACHKNNLKWGVSQLEPREYSKITNLNYQFIQALNLSSKDIENLCEQFINWINSVSYEDGYKALLFLLGKNHTEESIKNYFRTTNTHWIKALLLNPEIIKDKFIKQEIAYYIKNKIKRGCLGEIIVNGNFQFLITDPYAYMQHVCGLKVTGLLNKDEYYSNYWNNRNTNKIIAMRSPLTHKSECTKLNLIINEKIQYWYKYCKSGIIVNWFSEDTVKWAGSDWDGDIIFTSNNNILINGIHENELPIVYNAPTPEKKVLNRKDLYLADMHGFGSKIGQITNKSTIAYCLLYTIENTLGKDSEEYKLVDSRLKQCCKAQALQIDKTKIGKAVKSIPKIWVEKQKIFPEDDIETVKKKEFYNSILLTKPPYFFKYRYKEYEKSYKDFYRNYDNLAKIKLNTSLENLLNSYKNNKDTLNSQELEFINNYYKYSPLMDNDCTMNYLCKYLENNYADILRSIRNYLDKNECEVYKNHKIKMIAKRKKEIVKSLKDISKSLIDIKEKNYVDGIDDFNNANDSTVVNLTNNYSFIKDVLFEIEPNIDRLVNMLIDYYYIDNPKSHKNILWELYGNYICENIKQNCGSIIKFPIAVDENNEDYDLEYLGQKFKLVEIDLS